MKIRHNIRNIIILLTAFVILAAGTGIFLHLNRPPKAAFSQTPRSDRNFSSVIPDQILSEDVHDNEFVIVWDEKLPSAERLSLMEKAGHFSVIEEFGDIYMVVRCSDIQLNDALNILRNTDGIQAADPNYIMVPETLEGDSYGNGLWALDNSGFYAYYDLTNGSFVTLPTHKDIDINYPEARDYYASHFPEPEPVIIAVIDTGIDINHPDLAGMIWINEKEIPDDGIDNDENGFIDDVYGWDFYNNDNTVCHYETDVDGVYLDNDNHGTKVAGIIAAVAGNNAGIAGAASFAPIKLMSIKMNGGSRSYGTVANAIKAVNYATVMGAKVCNMSWGIQKSSKTDTSTTLESLKTAMARADMLFVCAAGNTGTNNDELPVYPASFNLPNSISVTWCNQLGQLIVPVEGSSEGSCYGVGSVDIAAPGVYIICPTVGGRYAIDSGSSLATPYVASIAAVLMSTGKNLYPSEIKSLIISTRKQFPDDGIDYSGGNTSGSGAPTGNSGDVTEESPSGTSGGTTPADVSGDGTPASGSGGTSESGSGAETPDSGSGAETPDVPPVPANPLEAMNGKIRYPGIPDMYAALLAAGSLKSDPDQPILDIARTFEKDVIILSVSAKDKISGIRTIRYAVDSSEADIKDISFFMRGISGSPYTGALRLAKGGIFSFYVSDYAGNETVIRYILHDDTTAPKIDLLSTFRSPSGTSLAVLDVSEYESGLSKFLLLPGTLSIKEFIQSESNAAVLTPVDGRLLLRLTGTGTYTLFAEDFRGNTEIYVLTINE